MIINKEKTIKGPSSNDLPFHTVDPRQAMKSPTPVQVTQVEEPPPYARNPAAGTSVSRLQVQPSTISQHIPPLPPRPPVTRNNTTNHLFIKTRHEPITGVYHIDPEMDTVALGKEGITAQERQRYNHKHKQRHRHHGRKGFWKRSEIPDPNAIFETRHGAIALDIGVMASPGSSQSSALIQATTRQGSVDINVLGVHVQRHLNMEIATRRGNVHILIPRSFSGYIQLHSRHGELVLLPRLASAMHLVYRREKEMQVLVGRAIEASPEKAAAWVGDTIHVSSRHGDVIIGYLGEDEIPTGEKGFWKKLTDFFQY